MTRAQPTYVRPELHLIQLDLLPGVISLPDTDAHPDDEDALIYKPLARVTVSELHTHLNLLAAEVIEATKRFQQLKHLLDLVRAHGAPDDARVWSVFADLGG